VSSSAFLPVQESFVSLQGEGIFVGTPSSFIRVAGCNLRCAWCDSPKTSWEPESVRTTLQELEKFCAAGPRHVVLTGGEPLLFDGIAALSQRLRENGHHVTIETAGTVWLDGVDVDLVSISPKLAHSSPVLRDPVWGARHDARRRRPDIVARWLARPWQLKFVVRTKTNPELSADLEELLGLVDELEISQADRSRVLLMPECTDSDGLASAYRVLVPICIREGFTLGQRLHIQLFGHVPGT